MMLEVTGDLWEYPTEMRVITTNGYVRKDGAAVMGRGCALEAKQRYPGLEYKLGDRITKFGNRVHYLGGPDRLVAYPVKHNWRERADITLINRSVVQLEELVNALGIMEVVIPRPGCGNGGLRWEYVRNCFVHLDDRFKVITYA